MLLLRSIGTVTVIVEFAGKEQTRMEASSGQPTRVEPEWTLKGHNP